MAEAEDRNQATRVLDVLEALCGFAATGAANQDLAEAVKTSPSNTTRALAVLVAKGWARKAENGRFFPAPAFTRLTFRVLADFQRAEQQLQDQRRNMTVG
jgi:DNA-binding IclR family transcriptional regulator